MDWIQRVKDDADTALKEIYKSERDFCLKWLAANTGLDQTEQKNLFQTAVVIFYDNVISGKLTSLTSKLSTYLISICKYQNLEKQRATRKTQYTSEFPLLIDHVSDDIEEKYRKEKLLVLIAEKMKVLGDPCKTLLELFYFKRLNMVDISIKMGYSNSNTAKNQKYKCIKRLQKLTIGI